MRNDRPICAVATAPGKGAIGVVRISGARADEVGEAYLPGYTHLQQAQHVLLAHHLLAHGWALARDYDRYKAIAERHGLEISARRVRHVLEQVEREREKTSAWRRVLELTNSAPLRNSPPAEEPEVGEAADADA